VGEILAGKTYLSNDRAEDGLNWYFDLPSIQSWAYRRTEKLLF